MKVMIRNGLLIFILIYIKNLSAKQIENIYTATIELEDKQVSSIQQQQIIQEQFNKILLQLTGKQQISTILDPQQYLTKYKYQEIEGDPAKVILTLDFDKKFIEAKISSINQAFLQEERPVTIIWPKTNNPIIAGNMQELFEKITIKAKDYALPIVYPVLDLPEVAMLNKDKDPEFNELIKAASKKYAADAIIIATGGLEDEQLKVDFIALQHDWRLGNQIIPHYDNYTTKDLEQVAENFLANLIQHFIAVNAQAAQDEQTTILLKITDVNDLEEYVKVEKYLQNLSIVKKIHASNFYDKEVEFKIIVTGGQAAIKNLLSNTSLFKECSSQDVGSAYQHSQEQLIYALNS